MLPGSVGGWTLTDQLPGSLFRCRNQISLRRGKTTQRQFFVSLIFNFFQNGRSCMTSFLGQSKALASGLPRDHTLGGPVASLGRLAQSPRRPQAGCICRKKLLRPETELLDLSRRSP